MKEFFVYINDDFELQNPLVVEKHFNELTPGRWKLRIEKANKRTHNQNAWLHAILPDVLEGLRNVGYNDIRTTEDAKDVLKTLFFKKKFSNGVDEIPVIQSTSETSKEDFSGKVEEIIIWANEYLGINVAPPENQLRAM